MRLGQALSAAALLLLPASGRTRPAETVPAGVAAQLPPGFEVLGSAVASFGGQSMSIVALGRSGELKGFEAARTGNGTRPDHGEARPLLVFQRRADGTFRLAGRNDRVVMKADDGGQCDPFMDGGGTIAAKGRFFTVQNGEACGAHWTDYVTFRFDDAAGGYVFDNERSQSSTMNPSRDPNAEAMLDGPVRVRRGSKVRPVPLAEWRPAQ